MLDLYHTTREELIARVLEQRDALADRDRRIAALETELAQQGAMLAQLTAQVGDLRAASAEDDNGPRGPPKGMPGLKPTAPRSGTHGPATTGPGARAGRGWRPRSG